MNCYIDGGAELEIGNNVGVGPGTVISTRGHEYKDPKVPIFEQPVSYGKIIIGDDVAIGANCFIHPGTIIGQGSFISAGAIISGIIPPYSIVVGNPGRVIANRIKKAEAEFANR